MSSLGFKIIQLSWEQTLPLRHQVLWPNKDMSFCKVDGDEQAHHFGVKMKGKLVCVASVFIHDKSARLRKFATLEEHQGKGIGSHLITHIISELENDNLEKFWCDARATATNFYRRFGMQIEGDQFYKSDIPYYKMSVMLPVRLLKIRN